MSESNIGARKGRNIRDHLFIVNGILNSVKQKESKPIEIQLYDISKALQVCYDICKSLQLSDISKPLHI